MKLVIGNDHAAVELKNEIKAYLEEKGHEVINIGTDTHDSCNYPEYGEKAGRMVAAGEADGAPDRYHRRRQSPDRPCVLRRLRSQDV